MARIETDPNYTAPTFSRATAATDLFKKTDVQALAEAFSTHNHTTGKGLAPLITSAMITDRTIQGIDIALATINANESVATGTVGGPLLVDGAVTAAKIANLTITSAQIALGAISQIVNVAGSSSTPTTTSTAFVDIPDMTVALTTAGGELLIWFAGSAAATTAGSGVNFQVAIQLDGGGDNYPVLLTTALANQPMPISTIGRYNGVAAGAHTVKARWAVSAGVTAAFYATQRYLTVLEIKR